MEQTILKVLDNAPLTKDVWKMTLVGDCSAIERPGQFINIRLDGLFLRRPISVCDWEDSWLSIIYKVVGKGTDAMTRLEPGAELDCLVGLGNGFDTSVSGDSPLLLGGGVGTPPMYGLAKKLIAEGRKPQIVLGFNTKDEVFYALNFQSLGCPVTVTTVDGSYGTKGFVTDGLPESFSYFYACGPMPMLKAVYKACEGSGQMSFEERMGCGFGACMGCSIKTVGGYKRVCKDGPVLLKEEILWD